MALGSRVSAAWLLPLLMLAGCTTGLPPSRLASEPPVIQEKLRSIVIPELRFRDAPVSAVVAFLSKRSRELDPEGVGAPLLLLQGPRVLFPVTDGVPGGPGPRPDEPDAAGCYAGPDLAEPRVSVELRNVTLGRAIRTVCDLGGLHWAVTGDLSTVVLRLPDVAEYLAPVRFYRLDPRRLPRAPETMDFRRYLVDRGVPFPVIWGQPATATYHAYSGKLVVFNLEENLVLIEELLDVVPCRPRVDPHSAFAKTISGRLRTIIIPSVDLVRTPLAEAVDRIRELTRRHDPDGVGVNLIAVVNDESEPPDAGDANDVAGVSPEADGAAADVPKPAPAEAVKTISLHRTNVSVAELLSAISARAGIKVMVEDHAVVICRQVRWGHELVRRAYPLAPAVIDAAARGRSDFDVRTWLEGMQVTFPMSAAGDQAVVAYDRVPARLVVRNSPDNLGLIEDLIIQLSEKAPGR